MCQAVGDMLMVIVDLLLHGTNFQFLRRREIVKDST